MSGGCPEAQDNSNKFLFLKKVDDRDGFNVRPAILLYKLL